MIHTEELSEERLLNSIDLKKLPKHIAIIMDGNGRWAAKQGFVDRVRGHKVGIETVRELVRTCGKLGIEVLTLYSFSRENWNRPKLEVSALMTLLKQFLKSELKELNDNNVKLSASGRLQDLPPDVQKRLSETIEKTSTNTGLNLNLALSYGGRTEIVDAVKGIIADIENKKILINEIDESLFSKYIYHPEFPEPDLLIRTSGEMRISNFLLWGIAYSEIYVTKTLWPDFKTPELYKAIIDYQKRERRYGKVL